MKLNKFFQLSIGALFAIPISFFGGEILANHFTETVEYEKYNDQLLACGGGGGGGGGGGSKPGALKTKKLTTKLNFKKRQLSKAAAAGQDTSSLQAEINKLESAIAEMD
jgi:hypothetical protein